ncbi:TolC family protein [Chryseobacterium lacus]|uniref:TolC family protein n=1 Tax=Chryseobacterium lacus TaxID=2058346 RepID=A0A368N0W4_9FLAO|nr:TolC family protein [Chryseobacterium lacus]RCU44118.1 TolC family protein [Chryseobacterium lacus]RST29050.1 TolC family protein [Chryseobacterium lacus]
MKKLLFLVLSGTFLSVSAQKKWTLQEAVDYAVSHNLQVISSDYNRKLQESSLQIAKREYLPSVAGNIGNTVSFGEGRDIFGTTQRNDNFSNTTSLSADVLLFNNGRLEKNVRKTAFDLEASEYDLLRVKDDISLQVAQQYLQILLNREIVKISASALENAQRQYDRARITTEGGATPQTVLAEAEAGLAREKQNFKNAEINTERSLFTLAQLLRIEDYRNFDVENVVLPEVPQPPLHSTENIIETAYQNQPQIKAAETRIKAAEAQTEVVETAFWPTVTAGAGLGTSYFNSLVTDITGRDLTGNVIKEAGFFQQYKNNFGQQISLSAHIPIFNKGITRLQVQQSKINEDIARNNLEAQKQEVLQNVQRAQFDAQSNYETYMAALEAAESSRLALDFTEKSFAAGKSTIYDVNIARNNYANAQGSIAQAKYNYLFSVKLLNFYAGIPIAL